VKRVVSRIFPELKLFSILLDRTWLIDWERARFMDELRCEVTTAASEIMKSFPESEIVCCLLKQNPEQGLHNDDASQIKAEDIIGEASEIRGRPSHCETLVGGYMPGHNMMWRSADAWEKRSGGNAELVAFDELGRDPVMREGPDSSGEKISLIQIELQHGREAALCWGDFEGEGVSAVTIFFEGTLFGRNHFDGGAFVFSKSEEGQDARLVVCPGVTVAGFRPISESFFDETSKRLEDQIVRQAGKVERERKSGTIRLGTSIQGTYCWNLVDVLGFSGSRNSAEDWDCGRMEKERMSTLAVTNALTQIKVMIFTECACLRKGTNKLIPKGIHWLLNSFNRHAQIIEDSMAKFRAQQRSVGSREQRHFLGMAFPLSVIEVIADSSSSIVQFGFVEFHEFSRPWPWPWPFVALSLEKCMVCWVKGAAILWFIGDSLWKKIVTE